MRIRSLAAAALLTAVAALPASAQQILSPNSTYLSETTQIAIDPSLNDFDTFGSVDFFGFSISFADAANNPVTLERRTVTDSWATWAENPETEWDGVSDYRVGYAADLSFVRFNFSSPIAVFGFEAEPNSFAIAPFTVNYYNGADLVGTIARNINGDAGARLLAFQYAGGMTHATVSTTGDFAMAQFRVGEATLSPVPEPSTYALMATGLVALAGIARRRRATV